MTSVVSRFDVIILRIEILRTEKKIIETSFRNVIELPSTFKNHFITIYNILF